VRRVTAWVVWTCVLFGWWLLLVDTVDLPQLVAGLVGAGLGALLPLVIEEKRKVPLRPSARWLTHLPYTVWRSLLDCGLLVGALAGHLLRHRPVRGRLRAVRFDAGGKDARSSARRVTVKWLDSLGPNSYVVGVDSEHDLMLVHQLVPPGEPASADPMELR
jgi:Na+/H+ ion antiporter subunit